VETSKLVFRGADRPAEVPETVPADLGSAAAAGADE
jgi:ATP-dependent Clp protease ATP-binding subunit ClpC